MNNFLDFIVEQKEIDSEKVKIIILSGRKGGHAPEKMVVYDDDPSKPKKDAIKRNPKSDFKGAKTLLDACVAKGIEAYIVHPEEAYISKMKDGRKILRWFENQKGIVLDRKNTVVLVRGRTAKWMATLDLLSQIEGYDIFVVNSRESMEICGDKYRTTLALTDAGIPTPKTAIVLNNNMLIPAFKKLGGEFPVVLKTITGSKGIGVFLATTWESLQSTLQTIWKINPDVEIIMQKFINTKYDMRIHVLGDKVIGAMKRFKIKNDFRSNYSLGGKIKSVELTPEQEQMAIESAKAVKGIWVGVDIMADDDGNNYVIEVNTSPGVEGIEKATGKSITGKVIDFLTNKSNWSFKTYECGYIERVHVEGFGEMMAKMDTGNGSYSVFHADDIAIDTDKVKFTHNGTSFEGKLKEYKNVRTTKGMESRPVVELDITFIDTKYKNIPFTLTDRKSMSTPVLLNRDFIKKARLSINPARRFVLTTAKEKAA